MRTPASSRLTLIVIFGFLCRTTGCRKNDDPEVPLDRTELDALLDPMRFIGRAPEQVAEYLANIVRPLLAEAGELPEAKDLEV